MADSPGNLFSSLFRQRTGRSYLISSWDARPIEKYPGVRDTPYLAEFKRKCVAVEPGESFTVADIKGPALITGFYFHFNVRWPRTMSRGLDLLFFWDEEKNPSVCSPVGDFFGSPFCHYVQYDTLAQSMLNGGYVSRFPMPFRRRARLVIRNATSRRAERILYSVIYTTDVKVSEDTLYFHAGWRRSNPTSEGIPHEVVKVDGRRGQYVGCHLYQQNLDSWIKRPPSHWIYPAGSGMGNMEGWDEVYVDGEAAPRRHDTGTEEYFHAGPYFTHGRSTGMFEGCTMRSYLTGRMAAYRFHLHDPIPFNTGFSMIWHHGLLDPIRSDFATTAFWYQEEPHNNQELPAFDRRLPNPYLAHAIQALFLFPYVLGTKVICRRLGA